LVVTVKKGNVAKSPKSSNCSALDLSILWVKTVQAILSMWQESLVMHKTNTPPLKMGGKNFPDTVFETRKGGEVTGGSVAGTVAGYLRKRATIWLRGDWGKGAVVDKIKKKTQVERKREKGSTIEPGNPIHYNSTIRGKKEG